MSEITYKDGFTLDGRLKPSDFGPVSKDKVAKVKQLWESARHGDAIADATLSESITTSDAIFSAAYLVTLNALPEFDRLPRTWTQVAGVRTLPDFRPAVLTGIFGNFVGLERGGPTQNTTTGPANPAGIMPVVPELEQYPYATIQSITSAYGQIKKRGFKVGWSWEANVNDSAAGFFDSIPESMIQTALDSEEWEVYNALLSGVTSGQQLTGGTTYQGNTVTANSALSRDAVILALFQLKNRQVNGRYVGSSSNGYNLIVPLGAGPQAEFLLRQNIVSKLPGTSGGYALSVVDGNDLGSVSVVESVYVTGTNWYLLPKPGGLRQPILELGRLRGNESPELRVENIPGNYIGGASVSPFNGSFGVDSIDVRIRYAITGILWFPNFVLWSTGVG